MKIFKNEVGRPSNEIIKKRRIFYGLVSMLCITIICVISILLYRSDENSLKGETAGSKVPIRKGSSNCVIKYDEYDRVFKWYCSKGYIKNVKLYEKNIDGKKSKKALATYSNLIYSKSDSVAIKQLQRNVTWYSMVFTKSDNTVVEIEGDLGAAYTYNNKVKKTKLYQKPTPEVIYSKKDRNFHYISYGTKAISYSINSIDKDGKVYGNTKNSKISTSKNYFGKISVPDLEDWKEYKFTFNFSKGNKKYTKSQNIINREGVYDNKYVNLYVISNTGKKEISKLDSYSMYKIYDILGDSDINYKYQLANVDFSSNIMTYNYYNFKDKTYSSKGEYWFGKDKGYEWYNSELTFVPSNYNLNSDKVLIYIDELKK